MACEVIRKSQDRLHLNMSQYFSDILLPADGEVDLKKLEKVHQTIVVLHRECDAVLLNVIPQMETELKIEDVNIRLLATKYLGEMFAVKGSQLSKDYVNAWLSWMAKYIYQFIVHKLTW